ncbi:uncharacterized protein [Spinacia oleracea]|uniref:Uncharacterized protein isoform X2 n=1 Tax=Spinacia oleracea TaxID=3562 RepID=A0ABM3RTA2_SPIOL|nr:uncharacterized protein LOC110786588 isoform X2 [Spinacia oleracea]
MLDGIFRSNFRSKCKSSLNRTKTRLEVIKKRRNAMQKFLKKDIAELLKSNLDRNAYGRAEGLYMELNLSSCYGYVEQCCATIAENLKEMHRQSQCPESCRVAVASVIYAAARFSDLPELRDLRNQFYEKYGKDLEPFTSKEFMENLMARPPTTLMKLQLMQEIAQEFSVPWDPMQLEQQLQSPGLSKGKPANITSANTGSDGQPLFRNKSTTDLVKGKQVDNNARQINNEVKTLAVKSRRRNSCTGLKENVAEKLQEAKNSTQEEQIPENAYYRKPFTNRIVPSPYIVSNNDTNDDRKQKNEVDDSTGSVKARPRSVRTKFLKPSTSANCTNSNAEHETDPRGTLSARVTESRRPDIDLNHDGEEEEEEAKLDKLLPNFQKKKVPESSQAAARVEDTGTPKFELPPPPGRRRYFFSENDQPSSPVIKELGQQQSESQKTVTKKHVRSSSYVNDVHPRMPDFDDLAERIAVLKTVQGEFEL